MASPPNEKDVAGRAHVEWSEQKTLVFKFHDFLNLPSKKGQKVTSPYLPCFGVEWFLQLYPGGRKHAQDGNVSIFFGPKDDVAGVVKVKWTVRIKGRQNVHYEHPFEGNTIFGQPNFASREDIEQHSLVDGTLTIEVDLCVWNETPSWIPFNTLAKDMLQMLNSGRLSDIQFSVGNETFRAHKYVIATRAPQLAELVEDAQEQEAVSLPNIDPDVFRTFLRFLYAGETPSLHFLHNHARSLLETADRFGCTRLKIVTQTEMVHHGFISKERCADLLLLADSLNCSLLMEASKDFFAANSKAVMSTEGFTRLKESNELLVELMERIVADKTNEFTDKLPVKYLLRELDKRGLDIDGSHETLAKRLRTS